MPHVAPSRSRREGFTLVEVLVATLLLTVGLLALAGTAGHLAHALTTSAAIAAGTNEARSSLERVRAEPCAGPFVDSTAAYEPQAADVTVALSHGATVGGARAVTLRTEFPCPR